jgi:hypothetical protein
MLVAHLVVHAWPERVAEFFEATPADAAASVREPGVPRLDIGEMTARPRIFPAGDASSQGRSA